MMYFLNMEQILSKYNINDDDLIKKLDFNDNKKYIYYEELTHGVGNRYNEIIINNENINDYSYHSPSCYKLYDVLSKLKITDSDSIVDIGSGKGFALTLMNLFPFDKICGIEISTRCHDICKNNLKLLNIDRINLLNIDIMNFNEYNSYNYFYFYNPFSSEIFEKVVTNISKLHSKIIYKNIHKDEIEILQKHGWKFLNEFSGFERNYQMYELCK